MKYFVLMIVFSFSLSSFAENFIFPPADNDELKDYAMKLSTRRNKYKIYRRIDVFRGTDEYFKKFISDRPHVKVIESLNNSRPPQVATIPVDKKEVSPFYSNYFREKRFTYHLFRRSWKERFRQRLDQFRHQQNGVSQIGPL